jgi:predicted dienelactone hydrolase
VRVPFLFVLSLSWLACPSPPGTDAGVDAGRFASAGRFVAGSGHTTIQNVDAGRSLPVEIWYPAVDSAGGHESEGFALEEFEPAERRAQLSAWIAQAPPLCTPRVAHSARNAALFESGAPWPLLVLSHCTGCFRFSMHSLAERLASQGFVVAAPDHIDNTKFDSTAPLTNAFLAVRAQDLSSVVTAMLDPNSTQVPEVLRGKLDPSRVGVVGHSFGAVTAGKLVETDARVKAGFLIAAPVDSPFLNSGSVVRVTRPLSWLLAMEDNSISYLGNDFIRDNFSKTPKPSWLLEVENAGHWTFSDIAGLGGDFMPGCGDGLRDPDGGAFTYLDNDVGRGIAMRSVSAWAAFVIRGDADAEAELSTGQPADVVHVRHR